MKLAYRIITLLIIALTFNACTHNNGDIGELFGTWKLQSITIDGEIDSSYEDNVLWKFQSSVMCMIRANDSTHNRLESWGTWSYANDDTLLELNFTHTDNDNPKPGSTKYSPLPETHLPKSTIFTLDIIKLNSSEMILIYHSIEGKEYQYKLKKWA